MQAPSDPVDELLFFHKSIRVALDALDNVAAVARIGTTDVLRAHALLEFFNGPMHWHDVDERDSLLPRLLRHHKDAASRALLAQAEQQHQAIAQLVQRLLKPLQDVAEQRAEPDADALSASAMKLRALVEEHLQHEETRIFPLAQALLTEQDRAEMTRELHTRREQRHHDKRD